MASSKLSSFLLLSFLLISSAAAFNITRILSNNAGFSSFSKALTDTQLVDEINRRQTITVLAVDNDAFSSVAGKPADVLKKILSVHVVLDYYDTDKLQNLNKKTAILTTLFQSSGQANGKTGFLNATLTSSGVALGSAEPGAGLTAKVVKSVAAHPYNISVLQINSVILPPGIENSAPPAPAATPKKSPSPAAAPTKSASPAAAPSGDAKSPSPSKAKAPAKAKLSPAPVEAPESDAPSSDAPASDAPSDSPAAAADAPAGSDKTADAPGPSEDSKSAGHRVTLGASLAVVAGVAFFAAL